MHLKTQLIIFWIELLILRIQSNNLEFPFQLSSQIIFLNLTFKLQNSNIKFQVEIKIFKIKLPIFKINKVLKIEIIIFRFKNNNLEFKYQFLDQISFLNLNNNFPNWNVNFHIEITRFKIEMSIFRLNY